MVEQNGRYEAEVVHDHPEEVDPSAPPSLTPKARTIIYIASLIVTVLTTLVLGVSVILEAMSEVQAYQIGALVYGSVALVNSSLGVGFRPTRPGALGGNRG